MSSTPAEKPPLPPEGGAPVEKTDKPDRAAKREQKELLLKAQVYRALAFVAMGFGAVVFMYMITARADGDILRLLQDPYSIPIFFLPFLPAAVLARVSFKAETKLKKILGIEE